MSEDVRGGRHRQRAGRVAQVGVAADPAGRRHHQRQGPWDAEEAPRDGRLRLDLGSVQLPVPRGARLKAEPDPSGPLRAVHAMVPEGRLTVSAFAAPRTGGLWPELVEELAAQLQKEGATIRRDRGEWGRELVARNGTTVARVIGVEGPRWMLRGVGTGPVEHALKLHGLLREMLRGTVVVRSSDAAAGALAAAARRARGRARGVRRLAGRVDAHQAPADHPARGSGHPDDAAAAARGGHLTGSQLSRS